MVMNISDNGSGIPKDTNLKKSNSLGMTLVNNFTEQLKANLTINSNSDGTRFEFAIPIESIVSN